MSHSITLENGVVISKYWGDVTADEIRGAREEIQALPGFSADSSHIFDFVDARVDKITAESLQQLMSDPTAASPLALQVVVAPDDASFKLAQRFQGAGPPTGRTILVVRSMAEARRTLAAVSPKRRPRGE